MATGARKPDFNLSAMSDNNVCKGRVGAGWLNPDGSINIKLNPFVVLTAMDALKLRLFPVDGYEERQKSKEKTSEPTPASNDYPEDDIPF